MPNRLLETQAAADRVLAELRAPDSAEAHALAAAHEELMHQLDLLEERLTAQRSRARPAPKPRPS